MQRLLADLGKEESPDIVGAGKDDAAQGQDHEAHHKRTLTSGPLDV